MAGRPYRAEMGPPPANVADAMSATGPSTRNQRMSREVFGSPKDRLTEDDIRKLNPVLEPVPGEEVGSRRVERKSEVYKKKMAAGGSASSRADGCCVRGKTKGKML